ncbi:MAG: porin family protein [Vicingaceae bacterium]
MKKLFAASLIFFSLLSLQAQDKSFQLGFLLAPNISWINPDSEGLESDGSKFGFSYGVIADFNIAENYSVSTGFTLLNSGGKIDYPDKVDVATAGGTSVSQGGRTTADIRLKYVQIPLTIKLKTNEIGYMRYFGQFGLGAAVNIDAEAETEFDFPGGSGTVKNDEVDFKDEISLFRASLLMGIGAEYNVSGNTSIMFGINFDNGFLNILSEDIYQEDPNGDGMGNRDESFKAINNSLILNFGVLF